MPRLAQIITDIIDFFHRPFAKYIPEQIFRYAACGGGNMVLDWVLYFLVYNFVIGHELVYLSFPSLWGGQEWVLCLTPHIASLCIVFPITLITGFWLQKYVTFSNVQGDEVQNDKGQGTKESSASSQTFRQAFRYILIVAVNLTINYFGLKLCVETLGWYPTPSKMCITVVTVIVSYIGQKYFTFATK